MAFRPSMGGIGGLGSLNDASVSGVNKPMNTDALIAHLVEMTPDQRKQFASMHADDPMMLSAAKYVDNKFKQDAQNMMARQSGAQPPVNQQAVASMAGTPAPAPQQMAQGLPEETGIGALPAPNMRKMASGGIVAFGDGGDIDGYDKGGTIHNAGSNPFNIALAKEGVQDPRQIAFLRAIYNQESSGGKNTQTSNRGAVGGMQIKPDTFDFVADDDMDINNPVDNARAGIRYALNGYQKAKGDPVLAGAYYYGGPNGLQKAIKGQAVSDPKNPKAPNTLTYGQEVAKRMADLLPIASAQAESLPSPTGQTAPAPAKEAPAPDRRGDTILTGLLTGLGGAATGAYEALTPSFTSGTTLKGALNRTAATMLPMQAVGTGGGILSGIASNYLSKLSPEDLEALQNDVGSDTGLAAAIMNPANRGPEVTAAQMPYGEQMKNVAKAVVMHPDTWKGGKKEVPAPTPAPAALTNKDRGAYLPESAPAELTNTDRGAYLPEGLPEYKEQPVAAPTKNPENFTADDWFALAAGLGQNKSQYFSEALGGGLQNLVANRAARRKYDLEKEQTTSRMALEKAQAAQAASHQGYYDYLTTGAKEEAAANRVSGKISADAQRQAARLIEEHMNKYLNSAAGMLASPQERELERARITPTILANVQAQLGSTMPAVAAAPALPQGVTVSKVGG